MPRLRDRRLLDDPLTDVRRVALDLGAGLGGLPDDELELAWELHGDALVRDYQGPPGTRPWAFWRFDLGEERPGSWDLERVRLAELGLLTGEELAALAARADEARARVGTPRERVSGGALSGTGVSLDALSVETWRAVARLVVENAS